MLPDRVSNPGPLKYESGALPIAQRGRRNGELANRMDADEAVHAEPFQLNHHSLYSVDDKA